MQQQDRTSFLDRKISKTFLHFAEPLLDAHGPGATADQVENSLKLAFTIWNAVVFEDARNDSRFIDGVRKDTTHDRDLAAFIDSLIHRKRKLYPDDLRLVGEYKVMRKGSDWRLRVEARDPNS